MDYTKELFNTIKEAVQQRIELVEQLNIEAKYKAGAIIGLEMVIEMLEEIGEN